jgi:hypothetical protein
MEGVHLLSCCNIRVELMWRFFTILVNPVRENMNMEMGSKKVLGGYNILVYLLLHQNTKCAYNIGGWVGGGAHKKINIINFYF